MAVKTIVLRGKGIRKEAIALGTITPGDLIERAAGGVQVHAGAGLNASKLFAVENEVVGNDIDTDYLINDTVLFGAFKPGDEIFANGLAALTIGDFVESNGAGLVRVLTASAATAEDARASVVGVVLETTGGAGRVKIEVM